MSAAEDQERRSRLDGLELEIFKLVQKRATSEQWREWLRAPLEHAAANGKVDLFTRLMDAGADGSAGWRGCDGRTLLGAAVHGKSEKMVLALLEAGAKEDINVRFGSKQETALHVAAQHGEEAIANALMLAGADSNVADADDDRTPLHRAARGGHHEVVISLLLNGARVNVKNRSKGNTPLHLAASNGHAPCVSKLLQAGADKDQLNTKRKTALFMAASKAHLVVAEELLAAGASLDLTDDKGWSALRVAANQSRIDVLRALLRHGGDAVACNPRGNSALHCAAGVGGDRDDGGEAVRVLLEAGIDVDVKNTLRGYTPLHRAVMRRSAYSCAVLALLEGGANVNAQEAHQSAPLHVACGHSNLSAVRLLLQWGADETLVNMQQRKAADCVGVWEQAADADGGDEERKADDQRIRHMIARAPADRCWRRRGWLVLCRYSPNKVQVTKDNGSLGGSAKVAKASCESSTASGGAAATGSCEFSELVENVVGLAAEGVFRLVLSFL